MAFMAESIRGYTDSEVEILNEALKSAQEDELTPEQAEAAESLFEGVEWVERSPEDEILLIADDLLDTARQEGRLRDMDEVVGRINVELGRIGSGAEAVIAEDRGPGCVLVRDNHKMWIALQPSYALSELRRLSDNIGPTEFWAHADTWIWYTPSNPEDDQ